MIPANPIIFDLRHGEGAFQQLYLMLQKNCLTFTEIGKHFGVTRERIRQIALMNFNTRGHTRRRICTINSIHFCKRSSFPEATLVAWRKARKFGLEVSHLPRSKRVYTPSNKLIINGKICLIRRISAQRLMKYWYVHPSQSKSHKETDFQIIILSDRRTFVFPRNTLSEHIYIPISSRSNGQLKPKVYWENYEDAWSLLATPRNDTPV